MRLPTYSTNVVQFDITSLFHVFNIHLSFLTNCPIRRNKCKRLFVINCNLSEIAFKLAELSENTSFIRKLSIRNEFLLLREILTMFHKIFDARSRYCIPVIDENIRKFIEQDYVAKFA